MPDKYTRPYFTQLSVPMALWLWDGTFFSSCIGSHPCASAAYGLQVCYVSCAIANVLLQQSTARTNMAQTSPDKTRKACQLVPVMLVTQAPPDLPTGKPARRPSDVLHTHLNRISLVSYQPHRVRDQNLRKPLPFSIRSVYHNCQEVAYGPGPPRCSEGPRATSQSS